MVALGAVAQRGAAPAPRGGEACWRALTQLTRRTPPQDVRAKVAAEAAAVFPRPDAPLPTREAMDSMHYTLATLKEVLRLYSVVPVVTRVTLVRRPGSRRRRVLRARRALTRTRRPLRARAGR